ncbi:hypothetical protein N7448_006635 [Penicillium atrosanguineum]|uniref:Uncharacterized protein n=1 Tax=Penicillium atrosanguineum TaxID=1132637 RepID=A0A9W9U1Q6_9EURO|nr:uncharacterized protein N7443_010397 [Penicillium atrosanguineum]KAJ5132477.1 hypothetical protein N7448_006635 [Penicillium atrosanguineum]KAJ5137310.1 hypothetical protein N7526_003543 [Penicillium atrosanguineum]KAJ5290144.1 hypothetical protein N7443_010397 [Penicillium atrosanguineum]KAJ5307968.1 hypothetical protein N7476_008624 [Penicillium atrosanguineum]
MSTGGGYGSDCASIAIQSPYSFNIPRLTLCVRLKGVITFETEMYAGGNAFVYVMSWHGSLEIRLLQGFDADTGCNNQ